MCSSRVSLLPITAPLGCHQYAPALSHYFFFFSARSKWIYYPSAARHRANGSMSRGWLGFHACLEVWTILQNSFSRMLTCETVLRDLSVKWQHALQKNYVTHAQTEGGDSNLEWPLKYQLHLCLQTHVKDFVSYWLLGLCRNVVLHWCLEIHEEIHARTQTCVRSVYSFSLHIKFNFNNPERLALFILVARFIVLLLLH